MVQTKKNVEVYETLEELVGCLSAKVSPNVKMVNVQNLFLYFVGFLLLVLSGFFADIVLLKSLPKSLLFRRCKNGLGFKFRQVKKSSSLKVAKFLVRFRLANSSTKHQRFLYKSFKLLLAGKTRPRKINKKLSVISNDVFVPVRRLSQ